MAKSARRRDARPIQIRVGERLRALREAAGLTQAEAARRAGLAKSFVSQVERGGQAASIVSLDRIARALRIPLTALFDDEPALPPPSRDEVLVTAIASELRGRNADFLAGVRKMVRLLDQMTTRARQS